MLHSLHTLTARVVAATAADAWAIVVYGAIVDYVAEYADAAVFADPVAWVEIDWAAPETSAALDASGTWAAKRHHGFVVVPRGGGGVLDPDSPARCVDLGPADAPGTRTYTFAGMVRV